METNLLDRMLDMYLTEQTPVTVVLQNKSRVSGRIRAFDSYVIVMENQKQEFVYRHALSSITRHAQEEHKRRSPVVKPAMPKTAPARSAGVPSHKPAQSPSPKPRQAPPQAVSASANEQINSSMKEGLLKWMQEQQSAK
jgi:RNA chaperone Hfq